MPETQQCRGCSVRIKLRKSLAATCYVSLENCQCVQVMWTKSHDTYHDTAHHAVYFEVADIWRFALKSCLLKAGVCFINHSLVSARTPIEDVVSLAYQLIAMVFDEGEGPSVRWLVARVELAMDVLDRSFVSDLLIVSMVAL
jgi:hypothetical protein